MLTQLTIPKKEKLPPVLDHKLLYEEGLKYVQRYASRIWSDYNVHDPGITILELLSYAVNELGYRSGISMKDLLASPTKNEANMNAQFFTAREILPNRALTVLDYRKLIIDLPGVKNAWLRPSPKKLYADMIKGELWPKNPGTEVVKEIEVQGLFDVHILFEDAVNTNVAKKEVLDNVKARLMSNRNLCQDFVDITTVQNQEFVVCAELELEPTADVQEVKAQLYFQVQQYLAPSIKTYSLGEMLEGGYNAAEIFEGPALVHGFIKEEELINSELKTEIRLSDIINILMDIEGVKAVKDIVVNPDGILAPLENKWRVPVSPGKQPMLNKEHSRIVFYKKNVPVGAKENAVLTRYNELSALAELFHANENEDFPIPLGTYSDLADYYSFQNHFPTIYGLDENGLSESASAARKAQAYQLKAYLLFFDQLLANYFSQLSHLKELFSTNPTTSKTYFVQQVKSFRQYNEIYASTFTEEQLYGLVEKEVDFFDRRNQFLDHLLARFAESFSTYAYISYEAFGGGKHGLIYTKCDFLNEYPAISSERSLAYNYSLKAEQDLWNSANVSGLERRVSRLLGIGNYFRRNLSEIPYEIYNEIDKDAVNEYRFRVKHRISGKILFSSSTKYNSKNAAIAEMKLAIERGLIRDNYQVKVDVTNKFYFNIIDSVKGVVARRIEYFDTREEVENAIIAVMQYLAETYTDDGMYLIENILLLPSELDDPYLPICPNPDCKDCEESDPYSYRLHIILPAYSAKFQHMAFRNFAEETIRLESPAHILPKICWISREDMAEFEVLYKEWIYLKSGKNKADRTKKLKDFIDKLYHLKNVYPTSKLRDCDTESESPDKFVLNQTALGTLKKDNV